MLREAKNKCSDKRISHETTVVQEFSSHIMPVMPPLVRTSNTFQHHAIPIATQVMHSTRELHRRISSFDHLKEEPQIRTDGLEESGASNDISPMPLCENQSFVF